MTEKSGNRTGQKGVKVLVTGADTELGYVTIRRLVSEGNNVSGICSSANGLAELNRSGATGYVLSKVSLDTLSALLAQAAPDVVLNLWPQPANSLLHDGQRWRNYDRLLPASTRVLLEAIKNHSPGPPFLVQTSYTLLYGNTLQASEEQAVTAPGDDPIFRAALRAETMLSISEVEACLLRLGYLYGPQSHDLKLYIKSFQAFRPYYPGPPGQLQPWLHYEDAASALALAVSRQPAGEIFNVADDTPTSFGTFMDYFAEQAGFTRPWHIPRWSTPLTALIFTRQQFELLDQTVTVNTGKIKNKLGWKLAYPSYLDGVREIMSAWNLAR
ncbi:MAG TPA: NAD-dependent epimerase/dehydratase family protein [Chloroflexia bacterium]|nr:NAD-dependent epimerase/dehydratase family protein [Chloroflexia bacterium]